MAGEADGREVWRLFKRQLETAEGAAQLHYFSSSLLARCCVRDALWMPRGDVELPVGRLCSSPGRAASASRQRPHKLWQIGCGKKGNRKNPGPQEFDLNRLADGGTLADVGQTGEETLPEANRELTVKHVKFRKSLRQKQIKNYLQDSPSPPPHRHFFPALL